MYTHLHPMHAPSFLVAIVVEREAFNGMGGQHKGDKSLYKTVSAPVDMDRSFLDIPCQASSSRIQSVSGWPEHPTLLDTTIDIEA